MKRNISTEKLTENDDLAKKNFPSKWTDVFLPPALVNWIREAIKKMKLSRLNGNEKYAHFIGSAILNFKANT